MTGNRKRDLCEFSCEPAVISHEETHGYRTGSGWSFLLLSLDWWASVWYWWADVRV